MPEPRLARGAEELAVLLCCAVRIEPALLRTARLELVPRYDVSAEADLWFSDWVATRSADFVVLRVDVIAELRNRLADRLASGDEPELAARIWDVLSQVHAGLSAALLLEEELALTALGVMAGTAAAGEIERLLQPALRAVVDERRVGIADWFAGALERLPDLVRHSTAAWQLSQPSNRRAALFGGQAALVDVSDVYTLGDLVTDTTLTVRHDGQHLHINEATGDQVIPIPDTWPRVVQVRWEAEHGQRRESLLIDPHRPVSVAVGAGPVRLQTGRGLIFEVAPTSAARSAPARRRALLIGATGNGLSGVDNDIEAMARALTRREFYIARVTGPEATRAGIIDAYERLIADTEPGDTAFVFYSGQGGRIAPPASGELDQNPAPIQFIVPVDYADSTDDDFRGILSVELSILLGRLTDRTHNTVVAFDCCHAAQMSHAPDLSAKALPPNAAPIESQSARHRALQRLTYETLRIHLDKVLQQAPAVQRRSVQRRHLAVQLAACAPEESAYEYVGADGERIGIFTESLTMALAEAEGLEITWAALMDRIRSRVSTYVSHQRPEVEGPSNRLLFSTEEGQTHGAFRAVLTGPGRVRFPGGAMLGVQVGDEFTIMPPGLRGPDDASKVCTVVVDRVGPDAAWGTVATGTPLERFPAVGAQAYRTAATDAAVPVRVPHADPRTADLVRLLAGSTSLRLADPADDWMADVVVEADRLTIRERDGAQYPPRPADPTGSARIMSDLDQLARAAKLRGLTTEPEWALPSPAEVEWGLVVSGGPVPLPLTGASITVDERIYVKVLNLGDDPVYVTLLDIGVAQSISVINMSSPSGVRLEPGSGCAFGYESLINAWTGIPVTWPDGLPRQRPRPRTIMVVTLSRPTDVSMLLQDGIRAGASRPRPADLVARDPAPAAAPPTRYAVSHIEFAVHPGA